MAILPIDSGRYGTKEMLEVFGEQKKVDYQLEIEAAAALYFEDPTDPSLMEDYGTIAKLNGYVDKLGNVTSDNIRDLLVDLNKLFEGD